MPGKLTNTACHPILWSWLIWWMKHVTSTCFHFFWMPFYVLTSHLDYLFCKLFLFVCLPVILCNVVGPKENTFKPLHSLHGSLVQVCFPPKKKFCCSLYWDPNPKHYCLQGPASCIPGCSSTSSPDTALNFLCLPCSGPLAIAQTCHDLPSATVFISVQ